MRVHYPALVLSALLIGCDSPAPSEAPSTSAEATAPAEGALTTGWALSDHASRAKVFCGSGDWCVYGAFEADTDYETLGGVPNTDVFDPLLGEMVFFAVSFDIVLYDQIVFPDPLIFTVYDQTDINAVFVGSTAASLLSAMGTDITGGHSSGMYLYYDWHTDRQSAIPAVVYGTDFNFQLYQPEGAELFAYTPGQLPESYPVPLGGKGEAIVTLRAYDYPGGAFTMTDYTTGAAFYYLEQL